jgi:hypothetical protein
LSAEHIRAVGKALVTEDLIGGRLTLSEAAARFRELEQLPELRENSTVASAYVRPGPWFDQPAPSEADRLYLRVLTHVEAGMELAPPLASAEVFARLEREYKALLSQGRPPTIPDLAIETRQAFLAEVRPATLRAASGQQPVRRLAPRCNDAFEKPAVKLSRLLSLCRDRGETAVLAQARSAGTSHWPCYFPLHRGIES